MKAVDDYEILIRENCRMTLYLVGNALKIKSPLKIVQQDIKEVSDLLYNRDKISN